ncbi:acyl carrier protein [Streptomyces noursei]|uniref:acyl carrier protein n=1 Tax=Streptomyces noursei TaxID=1971 RepID=UPI0016749DD8|nr:phosphopantetheine-binding protein [Streptomyces noursei]MCZ1014102.1 phosphopantetheine-binding protein [Streptomyces noursei]GGX50593.1 hypothetical protein GCM10010341_85260 [Streptomyces noursei]
MGSVYQIVTETVAEIMATKLDIGKYELRPEASFRELGFDSLTLLHMILTLEEKLNVEINDEAVFRQETVGDLIETLESQGTAA